MIYLDGQKLALAKDVVKPNLLLNSKHCEMNTPAGQYAFGKFFTISSNHQGSIYLTDSNVNNGIHAGGTTYFVKDKNIAYTQTLWFTTNVSIKPNFASNLKAVDKENTKTIAFSNVQTKQVGVNQYMVSGFVSDPSLKNFDISYIMNFYNCLNVTTPIQVRFDALKIEEGTESTDWCPAMEEIVTKSDLDDLKAEIEQLKSK